MPFKAESLRAAEKVVALANAILGIAALIAPLFVFQLGSIWAIIIVVPAVLMIVGGLGDFFAPARFRRALLCGSILLLFGEVGFGSIVYLLVQGSEPLGIVFVGVPIVTIFVICLVMSEEQLRKKDAA